MVITSITDVDKYYREKQALRSAVRLSREINDILKEFLSESDPEETIHKAIRSTISLSGADWGAIGFIPRTKNKLLTATHMAFPTTDGITIPYAGSPGEYMHRFRTTLHINDYDSHPLAVSYFKQIERRHT